MGKIRYWWTQVKRRRRKRIAGTATARIGAQGMPVNVVVGVPPSAGRSARNLARIEACKLGIAKLTVKGMTDHRSYKAFAEELAMRQLRYKNDKRR